MGLEKLRKRINHIIATAGKSVDKKANKSDAKIKHNGAANQPLTEDITERWNIALKCEEDHLTTQRNFHTSEFTRYDNRDSKYKASSEAWNQSDNLSKRFKNVMDEHKKHTKVEKELNKEIKAYAQARTPFKDRKKEARENALQFKTARADLGPELVYEMPTDFHVIEDYTSAKNLKGGKGNLKIDAQTESRLNDLFNTYLKAAQKANELQKEFHIVEFKEFDERQNVVNRAKAALANGNATPAQMNEIVHKGFQKCNKDVKIAEVKVADNLRRVHQKPIHKLFGDWRDACIEALKAK